MGRSLSGKRFLVNWAILTLGPAFSIAGPTLGAPGSFISPTNNSRLTASVHNQQTPSLQQTSPSQNQSPTTTAGTTVTGLPQTQTQTPSSPQPGQVGGPPS